MHPSNSRTRRATPRGIWQGFGAATLALLFLLPVASVAPARPKSAASTPAAKTSPGGFFLLGGEKEVPIPQGEVRITAADNLKYYRVPLGAVPETRSPVKIRDTFPSTGINIWLLKIKDDGLIFSWDMKENYFSDEIFFAAKYESKDQHNVMTWPNLEPGLYAFVEAAEMGIGKTCFVFRIVP